MLLSQPQSTMLGLSFRDIDVNACRVDDDKELVYSGSSALTTALDDSSDNIRNAVPVSFNLYMTITPKENLNR